MRQLNRLCVLGQRHQTGDDHAKFDDHEETGEKPLAALQLIVQNAVHNVDAAWELATADPPHTASVLHNMFRYHFAKREKNMVTKLPSP